MSLYATSTLEKYESRESRRVRAMTSEMVFEGTSGMGACNSVSMWSGGFRRASLQNRGGQWPSIKPPLRASAWIRVRARPQSAAVAWELKKHGPRSAFSPTQASPA